MGRKTDRKNKKHEAFVQHVLLRGERRPCAWKKEEEKKKAVTGCLFMYSRPTRARAVSHGAKDAAAKKKKSRLQRNKRGDGYRRETGAT